MLMKTYPFATEPALQPIYTCNYYKAPEMIKCEIYFSLMDRKLLKKTYWKILPTFHFLHIIYNFAAFRKNCVTSTRSAAPEDSCVSLAVRVRGDTSLKTLSLQFQFQMTLILLLLECQFNFLVSDHSVGLQLMKIFFFLGFQLQVIKISTSQILKLLKSFLFPSPNSWHY